MLDNLRDKLKPESTTRVYDVVSEAGIDVSDWHNFSSSRSPAQNPKYCYRWAFEGNDRVLLCLWHDELDFLDGGVESKGNARAEYKAHDEKANDQRSSSVRQRLKTWAARALQMDEVIKTAHRKMCPVRVALVRSKNPRRLENERASADYRLLDPAPWHLVRYDMETGEFLVRRGPECPDETYETTPVLVYTAPAYVALDSMLPEITLDSYGVGVADQFVGSDYPDRKMVSASVWERSAKVRQVVLSRSCGRCEHCGRPGFLKINGEIYLETHHIIPLSEEGADVSSNVIALCPEHHREAHYGFEREALKGIFLQALLTASMAETEVRSSEK
ncbi:HNH endonuclease [Pseudomonas moraviensis]